MHGGGAGRVNITPRKSNLPLPPRLSHHPLRPLSQHSPEFDLLEIDETIVQLSVEDLRMLRQLLVLVKQGN